MDKYYNCGLPTGAYTDPKIFDQEMTEIYERVWIFVGHESQIPSPGDYRLTYIGLNQVLVVRQKNGGICVLSNFCTHRGTRLCVREKGHTKSFVCPYHAWTFGLDGKLRGVPGDSDYPTDHFLKKPELNLKTASRVQAYRGFIFASFSPKGSDLITFLGKMTEAFDNLVDRAPSGEIFAEGGQLRTRFKGNWKMHHENAMDTVHPGFVHQSSVSAAKRNELAEHAMDDGQARNMLLANGYTPKDWKEIELIALPQGHSYMGGFYSEGLLSPRSENDIDRDYREALEKSRGKVVAQEILGLDRFNNLIWPNLSINAQYHMLRLVYPVSVRESIIETICFRLGGAPDEIFQRAVRFMTTLGSPASMIFSDDFAIFERAQEGLEHGTINQIELSRGVSTDVDENVQNHARSTTSSELPNRNQAKAWRLWMGLE